MGFRSTFTTEDFNIHWPEWFREKYANTVDFGRDGAGSLHSKGEAKTYSASGWADLPEDIRKAIDWNEIDQFVLVYLHECGGITRVQIERDIVKWSEPTGWSQTDGVNHHYCYGCSDI